MLSFKEKVYQVVKKIPKGKVLSYKQVAILAGNYKASQAVGNILHQNHNPAIPCHRVIRSNGQLGGYNKGVKEKIKILKKEKINLIKANKKPKNRLKSK
ncbi:MAG TPA: MGMT family protein [bacterium]|nr:MGMT family protein [bacterium]HPL95406.1 MGMT family protein [bacterium]